MSNLPIRRKLALTTGLTLVAALGLTCGALLMDETIAFRHELERDVSSTAEMLALSSAAGLTFRDPDDVRQVLQSLRAQPHIVAAGVYDSSGALFASYQRTTDASFAWPGANAAAIEFGRDWLDLRRPIVAGGEPVGTIFLRSDLEHMRRRLEHYALIAAAAMLVALLAALVIGVRLQRAIADPLTALARTAERVAAENNYALRATKRGADELGLLVDGFNHMLAQIQARDAALLAARNELERRVDRRTAELASSLSLLNATLESTNDGILALDLAGRITCHNARFGTIWNLPAELLEHPDPARILPAIAGQCVDSESFARKVAHMRRTPEIASFHVTHLNDGRTVECYGHAQRVDDAIVGLVVSCRDVTERKRAETELDRTHRELVDASRLAGMAEVATGVLHNVGNVLNSVNVSATLISDQVRHSKTGMIRKVTDLVRDNAVDLPAFLTSDPRGRHLPEYLEALAKHLEQEHGQLLRETDSLRRHVEHIRDIVGMQQSYAKVSGVAETVHVVDLVEDALQMNAGALQRHDVTLVREFQAEPVVTVQKHKVLQILVNLIRNAKYACDESGRSDKELRVRISATDECVEIAVIDNGVGIPAENLTRIFAHGFTTRKDGHGFGLHSGALAAKEIGGTLAAHSEGPGRGAVFTLKFPGQLRAAA